MKCPKCGSPNAPLGHVRERNVDLVLVDMRCLDCGYRWSAVMTWVAYQNDIARHVSFFGVLKNRGKRGGWVGGLARLADSQPTRSKKRGGLFAFSEEF